MNIKTTLLAGLGALFIAAPLAAQAQVYDEYYYDYPSYYHHDYDYNAYGRRCWIEYRRNYGFFGFFQEDRAVRVCR